VSVPGLEKKEKENIIPYPVLNSIQCSTKPLSQEMSFLLSGNSKPMLLCMERGARNWKSQQAGNTATLPQRDTITEYTCKKSSRLVAVTRVIEQPCDCQPHP